MMPELPYYIAAGAIGIVLILLVLILLSAWAERRGKPSAHIDWESGEP